MILKDRHFKYKVTKKDGKVYDVAIFYDRKMAKITGQRSYRCSLRRDGIIWAVETIFGAQNKTQALILLQYREIME